MRAAVARKDIDFTIFGDRAQLASLAGDARPPHIELEDIGSCAPYDRFQATAEGGALQLRALEQAARMVGEGKAIALVTAPTSKYAIQLSGTAFTGQTEYLAELAGLAPDAVTMLFLGPSLNVALVTTHVAVRELSSSIHIPTVQRALTHLSQALHRRVEAPTAIPIAVMGLNPHAGERGAFGREEIDTIAPACASWSCSIANSRATVHPQVLGAETALRFAKDGVFAGVVAMTHDQATIAAKLLDWNQSVNVTWGLPYVRTSPDHGVGFDAARSGNIEVAGMSAAIQRAHELVSLESTGEST